MPGNGSNRWQWTEDLLLPALGACARASWQWPWIHLLLSSALVEPGTAFPAWLVVLLLVAPGVAGRLTAESRGGRWAVAALGLISVVAVGLSLAHTSPAGLLADLVLVGQGLNTLTYLPGSVPLLIIALLLWVEGGTAAWLRYANAWRSTLAGVVALVLLAVLGASWDQPIGAAVSVSMVAFLITSLLSLALLSVRGTLALEQVRHSQQLGVNRYWLGAMLALILLLLLGGWAIASASAPEMIRAVLDALRAAALWLGEVIASALAWAMYGIFWLLEPLIERLQSNGTVSIQTEAVGELGEQVRQVAQGGGEAGPPVWWRYLSAAIGYLALGGIVLWLLLKALRRPHPPVVMSDEERDSVFSLPLLEQQLRSLFGARRRGKAAPYLAIMGDDPVAEVRRAYQELLIALAQAGIVRQPGQTPLALAHSLAVDHPELRSELTDLAQVYAQARYGGGIDATSAARASQAAQSVRESLSAAG